MFCFQRDPMYGINEVDASELQTMLSRGEKVRLVDVRSEAEFQQGIIEGAEFLPLHVLPMRMSEFAKDEKIVVYCSVGYRSEKIAEKLTASGFTNVVNLYGGIFEWINQDKPVVDQSGSETELVHAYSKKWGIWLNEGVKVYE